MFENLQVFRMSSQMATHAGHRQGIIARNMANSDTPGYAAKDIAPFKPDSGSNAPEVKLLATRISHLNAADELQLFAVEERRGEAFDPNGNSVSLESEMLHAVAAKRQHDRALAIYRSSLGILRTAIGRR